MISVVAYEHDKLTRRKPRAGPMYMVFLGDVLATVLIRLGRHFVLNADLVSVYVLIVAEAPSLKARKVYAANLVGVTSWRHLSITQIRSEY